MEKERLSIFYLNKKVLFPFCSLFVRFSSKQEDMLKAGDRVLAVPVRSVLDILLLRFRIATLCEVVDISHGEDSFRIQLKGISRVRLKKIKRFRNAFYEMIAGRETVSPERLIEDLRKKTQELIFLVNVNESDKLIHLLNFITSLDQLTDFISHYFIVKFPKRYTLLHELDPEKRARQLIMVLGDLITKFREKQESDLL